MSLLRLRAMKLSPCVSLLVGFTLVRRCFVGREGAQRRAALRQAGMCSQSCQLEHGPQAPLCSGGSKPTDFPLRVWTREANELPWPLGGVFWVRQKELEQQRAVPVPAGGAVLSLRQRKKC